MLGGAYGALRGSMFCNLGRVAGNDKDVDVAGLLSIACASPPLSRSQPSQLDQNTAALVSDEMP